MLRKLSFIMIVIFINGLFTPFVLTDLVQAETDDNVFDALNNDKKENTDKSTNTEDTESEPLSPLDEDEGATVNTVDNQFGLLDFFNLIFALFLVLTLLYVTLRFIKRKNQTYTHTKTMMNLGGTSLGGNRSVQLVKVGDRVLVVGVGEDIQLLKEIDSKEEIEKILTQQQNDIGQMLQPTDIISKILEQFKSYTKDKRSENNDFKSILSKQLSELSNGRKKIMDELEKKGKRDNE